MVVVELVSKRIFLSYYKNKSYAVERNLYDKYK